MNVPSSKFKLIHSISSDPDNYMTITELCALNKVSRSGYYSWLDQEAYRNEREAQDRKDFDLILDVFTSNKYPRGARGIYMGLQHRGQTMNLKKIRRLMKKYNLVCPIRKANPYRRMAKALKTSNVAPNLVKREFELHGARTILLTDITYIQYSGGTCYLSTILDAYTKQILAWRLSPSLEVDFVLETVEDLMENHRSELNTDSIIHSDQGCHYTSYSFIELVKSKKLRQSMSRRGNCWDNAPIESFHGHMKDDLKAKIKSMTTFKEVEAEMTEWLDYYNNNRYQWQLAKLSPNEFYQYQKTGIYPMPGGIIPTIQLDSQEEEQEDPAARTGSSSRAPDKVNDI